MKTSIIISSLVLFVVVISGCKPDVVDPEFYGAISGTVINSETDERISGASIETNPPTEVILTDEDGNFEINEVPTGSYQIKVNKSNFKSKSVTLKVKEDRVSSATIVLNPENGQDISKNILEAQVTSWNQTGASDSSFVDVEFRVNNTSSSTLITEYEIYFDIHTNGETYYFEARNEQLEPGEQNFGKFEKYVRNRSVDSVTVSDVWLTDDANNEDDSTDE